MGHEQLAELLKAAVEQAEADNPPSPAAWTRIERRLRREPRRRVLIAGAAAAVVVAIVAVSVAVQATRPSRPPSHPTYGRPMALTVLSTTRLPGEGIWLAAGFGAAWVAGTGLTYEVDQATGRLVRSIVTPDTNHAGCGSGITAGFGAVWVTYDCRGVYRIDPRTGRITSSIAVTHAADSIAAAYGFVWVATRNGDIVRIDPGTNAITGAAIPVGYDALGGQSGPPPSIVRIVPGAGTLWADTSDGFPAAIDPVTSAVRPLMLGNVSAVGAGSVWVPGAELEREELPVVQPVLSYAGTPSTNPQSASVAFWRGQAWALTWPGVYPAELLYVQSIDPADNSVSGGTTIPRSAAASAAALGEVSITGDPAGLWVLDPAKGLLFHLGRAA